MFELATAPNDETLFNIGYTLREPPESFAARPVT
jgi:hypothetical protein